MKINKSEELKVTCKIRFSRYSFGNFSGFFLSNGLWNTEIKNEKFYTVISSKPVKVALILP